MTPAEAIEAAELAEAETRYRLQLAREMYQLGLARGRAEHVAEAEAARIAAREVLDPEMVDTINRNAAAEHARIQEARWGPGGRAHFADPRPGDFRGRGRAAIEREPEREPERELEAEAG